MLAIPWYFAQQDQLGLFGIVYLITNILSMFWVPVSGSIVDKYDRKKVFLFITMIGGCILGTVTTLGYSLGELPLLIVGSVFMTTFLHYNIHYPCLYAFVQEITERKYYARMTSVLEIVGQLTTIMAGALATLLLEGTQNGQLKVFGTTIDIGVNISKWDIHEIFLVDTITYFASFIIILFISYTPILERETETGGIAERLKAGWTYLIQDRPTMWFGVFSFTVFLAMLLEAFYLGVSYVSNHLQETGDVYANSKMAYSSGAILIGLSIRHIFKKVNIPLVTIILTIAMAIIFFVLSATNNTTLFFGMMLLVGICNAGTRIARITYLFKNVANQFFGRAHSVFFLFNVALRIVMLAVFTRPFFQLSDNIVYAYVITGVMLLMSTVVLIKHYRTFDLNISS